MQKPYFFIDFDGLLYDTIPMHVTFINETFGISSTAGDYIGNPSLHHVITTYGKGHIYTEEMVYAELSVNLLRSEEVHLPLVPISGSAQVIKELAKKYELIIVTAREIGGRGLVWKLIERDFHGCISDIHCQWRYDGNHTFTDLGSKYEFIARLGGGVAFIDDCPKQIKSVQHYVPSYLFDSHGHFVNTSPRFTSWEEIAKKFL